MAYLTAISSASASQSVTDLSTLSPNSLSNSPSSSPSTSLTGVGAQPAGSPLLSPSRVGSDSYLGGSLGFEAAGYLYSPRTKSEDIYPTVMAKPEGRANLGVVQFAGQGEGIVMAPLSKQDNTNAYFELPEIYFGTSPGLSKNVSLSLGRKLENWNHLDDQWNMGIWQPRYRWDYLRPDPVALTGLTAEVNAPYFKSVLFFSPFFIPERGIPVSNDNGQLISNSPWFISPPTNIQVLSHNTPLQYDLQIPPTMSIVENWGVSYMMRVGDTKGPWSSVAYAYKPMNQLLLSYDGHLILDDNRSSMDVAEVPVQPRVVYQNIWSFEAGYEADLFSAWVSSLYERPGKDEGQALTGTWTEQTVTRSVAISPTLQIHTQDDHYNRMKADVSYLYQDGGNGPDTSATGQALLTNTSVFESRYPFQSAFRTSGELDLPNLLSSIGLHNAGMTVLASSFLYDIKNRGSIFTFDVKYLPSPRWEADLGADILGSEATNSDGNASTPTDFIGRYQANDRVRAGVKYVF